MISFKALIYYNATCHPLFSPEPAGYTLLPLLNFVLFLGRWAYFQLTDGLQPMLGLILRKVYGTPGTFGNKDDAGNPRFALHCATLPFVLIDFSNGKN